MINLLPAQALFEFSANREIWKERIKLITKISLPLKPLLIHALTRKQVEGRLRLKMINYTLPVFNVLIRIEQIIFI